MTTQGSQNKTIAAVKAIKAIKAVKAIKTIKAVKAITMAHRCGAMTTRGGSCRKVVENEGERCAFHTIVENQEEEEHSVHSVHTAPQRSSSPSSSNPSNPSNLSIPRVSNDNVMALMVRIGNLEAELNKAMANKQVVKQAPKSSKSTKPAKKAEGVKRRNMTPAGANRSARWIFYNEHKFDEDILNSVRGGLSAGNMLVKKTQVVNGVTIEKEHIPYTLVKIATDLKFDALTEQEQESYVLEAYDRNEAKYA